LRIVASALGAALVALVACGTDAAGVDSCKKIEEARCQRAPACNISLTDPPHRDPDVEACLRFYDIACLHGLEVGDPGTVIVQGCVTAIQNNDCNTVLHPETDPACAWLIPIPTPDAGTDGTDDGGDGGQTDGADATTD
jgi:hypothetical protein